MTSGVPHWEHFFAEACAAHSCSFHPVAKAALRWPDPTGRARPQFLGASEAKPAGAHLAGPQRRVHTSEVCTFDDAETSVCNIALFTSPARFLRQRIPMNLVLLRSPPPEKKCVREIGIVLVRRCRAGALRVRGRGPRAARLHARSRPRFSASRRFLLPTFSAKPGG